MGAAPTASRPFPSTRALAPGDVAPRWDFRDRSGGLVDLTQDWIAGNWIVLCLHPTAHASASFGSEKLGSFSQALHALGVRYFAVVVDDGKASQGLPDGLPVLIDHQNRMTSQLGLSPPRPLTVVLRPDGHLAQFFDGPIEQQLRAAGALARQAVSESPTVTMALRHPPVLLVPDVFSYAECRILIERFHTEGQTVLESDLAIDHIGADYKMRVPEHMREDRVDHFFFDPQAVEFLSHRLNRIVPEIARAFQYPVTKVESLRMARYEGTRGGHGHGHRDNVPPTEHRRFAMSINLNTEEFAGGELRFPEFGDVRYRPASGTAIIFSSSLLHEAMQVTRGTRYVFLAFLFGDR